MRITLTIIIYLLVSTVTWGVDNSTLKKQINDIKKNSEYVYVDITQSNEKEALDLAQELLYQRVNEFIADAKRQGNVKEGSKINRDYSTNTISLPRGNMYRVFLYVSKFQILPTGNSFSNSPQRITSINNKQAVIIELLKIHTFAEMKQRLAEMKEKRVIIYYDKYKELPSPENYTLIIFDNQGKIRALLSEGRQRQNLKTKSYDTLSNYKGCGAIGIKTKFD